MGGTQEGIATMPEFRVIGGPHDGMIWRIACMDDGERLYVSQFDSDYVEHVYELSHNGLTAAYKGWRMAPRKTQEQER